MISEITIERLSFTKYMAQLGMQQATLPEPLSAAAVLMLHDALELFLQISLEERNIGKERVQFMEYFSLLEADLGAPLPNQEAIRRFNKARVALKHHGTLPSRLDITGFAKMVPDFLQRATPLIFGLEFSKISLAHLVLEPNARAELDTANSAMAARDHKTAAVHLAVAFEHLIRMYGYDHLARFKLPYLPEPSRGDLKGVTPELGRTIQDAIKAFELIENELRIIRWGIDPTRYRAFRALTPEIGMAESGVWDWWEDNRYAQLNEAQITFCYNFVVECALLFQRAVSVPNEIRIGADSLSDTPAV